jgi:hypothetical protein
MIKVHRDLGDDWYVVELTDSHYYQIIFKWDLYEMMAERFGRLYLDDFPMTEEELADTLKRAKELREYYKDIKKL